MKRNAVAALHSGYWTLQLAGVSLFLIAARVPRGGRALSALLLAWPIAVILTAPGLMAFYTSYGFLFPRFLAPGRLRGLIAAGTGVALATAAAALGLAVAFFGFRQPVFSRPAELFALVVALAGLAAVHGASALVVRGFVTWYGRNTQMPIAAIEPPPEPQQQLVEPPSRDFIFVKTEQRLERVRLDEILVIEGQRDYRRIHTQTRRIMTLQTFSELEASLPCDVICRVHKSYMVGVGKIDSIERGRITIQQFTIPISDTYRERFYTAIGQR